MSELRFHRQVYARAAVDEAVQVFGAFASFDVREAGDHWVVELRPRSEGQSRQIAGEFSNYVLGLTVKRGSP